MEDEKRTEVDEEMKDVSPSPRSRSHSRERGRSFSPKRRHDSTAGSRSKSRPRSETPPPRLSSKERRNMLKRSSRIIIDNLQYRIREAHIEEIFGHYGPIRLIDFKPSFDFSNRRKCYVTFSQIKDAQRAIDYMDQGMIEYDKVEVEKTLKYSDEQHFQRRLARYHRRKEAEEADEREDDLFAREKGEDDQYHYRPRYRERNHSPRRNSDYYYKPSPRNRGREDRSRSPRPKSGTRSRSRSYTPPPRRKSKF